MTLRRDGRRLYVDGRIVLTAQDGGLLFLSRDGLLWRILPNELVNRTPDDKPFRAYPAEQMAKSIMADLPKGFTVYQTQALHDLLRHVTGLRSMVRGVVRAVIPGIP